MTTGVAEVPPRVLPVRALRALRDVTIGTLLCLTPVTAVLVLGWLVRRMHATIVSHEGRAFVAPGWILGHRGSGFLAYWLGGLAANIRIGVLAGAGLFALTLPFTLAWLGAWWAGWDNSFNKGYEQAAIGPLVWAIATLIALVVLVQLPIALAHAARELRFGAFFEWRRIGWLAMAAGPRLVWLALLSIAASVPFFGLRALPVFIEGIVPGFADMDSEGQANIAGLFDLAGAALAFVSAAFLKHRAAVVYAKALPRTGAALPALRESIAAPSASPPRRLALVWIAIAAAAWSALPALIVFGQFMNYAPVNWLTHPVFLLPWAG